MYEYFIFTLVLFCLWLLLYVLRKDLRKHIIFSSTLALPLGFSESFFFSSYWSPSTLFHLAERTGFDLESFLFSFSVGGIAAVLYETLLQKHLRKAREKRRITKEHVVFLIILLFIFFVFFSFLFKTFMHAVIVSMALGGLVIMFFRKDLIKETFVGGFLFFLLYFLVLFFVNTFLFPGWVSHTWNVEQLSGILILGIPLEELLWAFTFGFLWAPLYEYLCGYTIS